ncbi:hypothetical protein [Microbacterium sp. 4NA327F11]|uniref:hypothetical protein n=1 Tax=Microbacterium sp. 4NA327F11 TaxID=2502229 RepID=UPI0010F96288|nr:hypothetical protein [Microbacterium sp. 4NA327F11]
MTYDPIVGMTRGSRRGGPPRRPGHSWWAYVMVAVIAVGVAALVYLAVTHDYTFSPEGDSATSAPVH